jgi:uncharacterized protein (TIGR02118 family)
VAALIVTYPGREGGRFDGDYYVATHLPLVEANWGQYGLTSTRAFLADGEMPSLAAIAVLEFSSGAAVDTALASPEAGTVFGDIVNFTDLAPVAQKCV